MIYILLLIKRLWYYQNCNYDDNQIAEIFPNEENVANELSDFNTYIIKEKTEIIT